MGVPEGRGAEGLGRLDRDQPVARLRPDDEVALHALQRVRDGEPGHDTVHAVEGFDETLRDLAAQASGPVRLEEVPRDLVLALTLVRDAFHQAMAEIAADKDSVDLDALAARQQARGALEEVHDVAGALLAMGPSDVVWLDPGENRAPALRIAPLSVAGLLRSSLFDRGPVAITSATLTVGGGFDPLLSALGLSDEGDRVVTMDVGSPFDHARQGILYVAQHLPPPGRDGVAMEALDELAELIEAAGGRTLALFSSWRGVERAAEYLRVRLGAAERLLVQKRGDSVGPLVQRFADDPASVLLGTISLWQGVDVPGEIGRAHV